MACDFDITKENIYDYIIEDTPGADEAIKRHCQGYVRRELIRNGL